MNRAAAWSVRGVGRETREIAEEAARRAGMSLGDWLDQVVAEQAAEVGLSADDWDEDAKIDAIGDRLSRLSRRGRPQGGDYRRQRDEDVRPARAERNTSSEDSRRSREILEMAIAKFDARASKTEERAARALESVANWIEVSEADRAEERASIQAVAEKLSAIEENTARQAERSMEAARYAAVAKEPDAEIDDRLNALAQRVAAADRRRARSPMPTERPRADLRDASGRIARRQSEFDARETASNIEEPSTRGWRNFGVDPTPPVFRTQRSVDESGRPRDPGAFQPPQDEIAALRARLERMRAEPPRRRSPAADTESLRAEVAAISRRLADLAPPAAKAASGPAANSATRSDASASRSASANESLAAPLSVMFDQIRETLRSQDPRLAAEGLEREIRALGQKVERIASATVDPEIFQHISNQTSEVRGLLNASAMQPASLERLERQIADLAKRIDKIANDPTDPVDADRIVNLISATRAQIERSAPTAALTSIEKRLDQLAARLDDAVRRIQPATAADPRPMEDIARRIEGIRAGLERQAQTRPDIESLEAALHEINSKLDRAQPSRTDTAALSAMFQDLARRLEQAVSQTSRLPDASTKHLEELARSVEDVRATLERQSAVRVDTSQLEGALRDINSKLDRPASPTIERDDLASMFHGLAARLEDAIFQPKHAASSDQLPFDDVMRRIDDVRTAVEQQSKSRLDTTQMEAALQEISAKLDRAPSSVGDINSLSEMIMELGNQIERRPNPVIDAAPLERVIRSLGDRPVEIDTAQIESLLRDLGDRIAAPSQQAAKIESTLNDINAKLDRAGASASEAAALGEMIRELGARLDKRPSAPIDTAPLERVIRALGERPIEIDTTQFETLLRDLGEKIAAASPPPLADTAPIERLLNQFDAKIDSIAASRPDTRSLEQSIRELHEKFELQLEPLIDSKLVEQAADLLSKRMESRGVSSVDTDALVNQISEIHGRLDSLNIATASNAALERTVAELLDELDVTREILQSTTSAARDAAPLAGRISELKAESIETERRMLERLSAVQDILEKLVNRVGRVEEGVAVNDDIVEDTKRAAPNFASSTGGKTSYSDSKGADEALRSIPDRTSFSPQRGGSPDAPGASPTFAARSSGASDFLLEPGAGAPARVRNREVDSPAASRNAGINAHIAAARRAAQAAILDDAAKAPDPQSKAGPIESASAIAASASKQAQAFFAARRRPILLGVALFALATTLAVFEFRGGRPQAVQKSELSAPVENLALVNPKADVLETTRDARNLDLSPLGSIATPVATSPPALPHVSKLKPAPADLIAALPVSLPSTLRDAATAGETGAQTELALRYLEGRTVQRDASLAAKWFELAAAQGYPVAQYRLAALYEKGTGVARDTSIARSWYLKAADAGNARAMHNLAVLFAEDAGSGKPDYAQASQWFRKAGELGVRDSQFNLGVLFGRGLGVAQDLSQSWLWFSLAAQQGDGDAAKKRDEVAAKLDAKALAAAGKALAEFKTQSPIGSANDSPAPPGGWDGKASAPQASRPVSTPLQGSGAATGAHG